MLLPLLVAAALAADPAPPEDPPAEPTVDMPTRGGAPPVLDVVQLTDGQILEGTIVRSDDDLLVLRLADGRELPIPQAVVGRLAQRSAAIGTMGTFGIDPNRGRYFYSPAAFPLGQGNVTLAQRALALTTVAFGLLPGVDLEIGTVVPTLFIPEGQIAVVGGKGAVRVMDGLRLGAGAQAFALPGTVAGFAFGTVTIGEPDLHGSINGGVAMDFLNPDGAYGVFTLSLSRRFSKKVSFITENWVMVFPDGDGPWNHPLFVVPSGGVRVFGSGFSVDIGLVPVITGESDLPVVPLPWISFVGNLRTARSERAALPR